jgi:hypothetical protein
VDRDFTWRDGDRIIRFGRGAIADAPELLGDDYVLLTTERAAATAPAVASGAAVVHHVPVGRVDDVAGDLLDAVDGALLVALGGGRVGRWPRRAGRRRPPYRRRSARRR